MIAILASTQIHTARLGLMNATGSIASRIYLPVEHRQRFAIVNRQQQTIVYPSALLLCGSLYLCSCLFPKLPRAPFELFQDWQRTQTQSSVCALLLKRASGELCFLFTKTYMEVSNSET